MLVHLTFTVSVLGLTVINYYAGRKSVLYPAFIFSFIWLLVLNLYMIPVIEIDPLGADTLAVVVAGIVAFSIGAALVPRISWNTALMSPTRNVLFKKLLFFYCLVMLPAFYWEIQRLSGAGGLEDFMISARTAMVEAVLSGEKPFRSVIFTIAPMIATFSAFVFLIELRDWHKERVWACGSIIIALAFSILTTGRTSIMELTAGLLGIFLLKAGRVSAMDAWKYARWPLIGLLVLLSILVPVNKETSKLTGGATEAIADYVFGYTVAPLAGFNYVVHHPSEYRYEPNHTFKQVLPFLARISNIKYSPPPTLDDFVMVPFPTNVYTVFKIYYVDFGLFGMLVTMLLFGAGQTWLYKMALRRMHFYVFLYAISLYPLVMIAFDDAYSLILNNLVAFVFGWLYFKVLRTIQLQTKFWAPALRRESF